MAVKPTYRCPISIRKIELAPISPRILHFAGIFRSLVVSLLVPEEVI